ncbi:tetratricopeptide repeat protein [Natrarchaeobius halalkaliphilus]|uniref:Tetratricopeptide repeat protein n=1 Tax=Natrarchaeobius halalkaliphilus TaxID=1679091 RepID=A0A3N6LHI7_9EURY|nr:tetratricopeptide repeat protein [Natrarchaeobius halalkaliphilus]RQG86170.1 tetratricopeptide repeat protein [Natrarchaeobius halalkaliphilus]
MVQCRYCEQTFEEESALREHLYEVHERDEFSRIDQKRVEQYVDEHGLDESDNEEEQSPDQSIQREQRTVDTSDGIYPADRWELSDVEALSTDEIVAKLTEHGIETNETTFRNRVEDLDSATTLSEQWEAEYEVDATGYDQDFIWMAAQELWERWAPETPNKERIYDFVQEGRDLREKGNRAEACDQWLTAWEDILAVIPDDSTTIEEADRTLPTFLSLEAFIRSFDNDLATVAEDDPTYHEHRLEFCRQVCEKFPDADEEFLLDFRHFVADSLAELDRTAASRAEFEALIEEYPEDSWAYKKLADNYWLDDPNELSIDELERTAELYRAALDVEGPLEGATMVADRLEEVERRLTDARASNERGAEEP